MAAMCTSDADSTEVHISASIPSSDGVDDEDLANTLEITLQKTSDDPRDKVVEFLYVEIRPWDYENRVAAGSDNMDRYIADFSGADNTDRDTDTGDRGAAEDADSNSSGDEQINGVGEHKRGKTKDGETKQGSARDQEQAPGRAAESVDCPE